MASNRFTVIRPQEFQQTYEPFPLEKMLPLAQYKQGREDKINAMLGKAAGDAAVEGGLFTQPIAQEITKQRVADIDRLTGMFQDKRDVGSTIRELSKLQQQWQSDPRLSSVQSDAALKNTILANMAKPEYGTSMMYGAYDENTGQFVNPDVERLVNSGYQFTPRDYNLLQNPGAEAAWGKTIDLIKPDILKGYTKNEDGTYSSAVGDLDMNTMFTRASGLLSNISSDGINIDHPEALSTEAQQYIQYMQEAYRRDGKTYTFTDALDDFKDQAALRLQIKRDYRETDPTDTGGGSEKGKDIAGLIGASLGPTTLIDASDATMTEIGDGGYKKLVEATGFDYYTLKDKDGISAFDYVASDYVNNPSLTEAENRVLREQHVEKRRELDTQQYNNTYNQMLTKVQSDNIPKKVTVNGQTIVQSAKSPKVIEQEAHDKTMSILEKRRLAGVVAVKTALEVGEDRVPQFDKDGNIIGLTEEQKQAQEKWYKRNRDRGTATGAAGTVIIGGQQTIPKGFVQVGNDLIPAKYEDYYTTLDKNTKETFGNRSFVAKQYALYSKGGELGTTDIPVNQKEIVSAAKTLAEMSESNIFFNGRKINAVNTKGSSIDGHSMDKLYLTPTADGKQETADFTKGDVEFNPMSIYWNPHVNKWLSRGKYSRTGVEGEDNLESAVYEVDVTPTMSSILTGDQILQNAMQDAVHDALLSIPKGTSGVANVGMTDEQLKEFGNIHVIHNADGTYEVNGTIMGDDGKKVPISKVIRDKHDRDPSSLDESFAKEVIFGGWLNQNKYSASKNKEVKSEDHGLMQINDATWASDSARASISKGGTDWSKIPFEQIAKDPSLNIRMSADIVRNTNNGWSNWSTYNNALKGDPNSNWEDAMDTVRDPSKWFAAKNSDKLGPFIQELSNSFGKANMKGLDKYNAFGLDDDQMAFVIMMAESGGDPTAVGQNFKK